MLELVEVVRAIQSRNILTKQVKIEAVEYLQILQLFQTMDTIGIMPDGIKDYLNSEENLDLVKLRTAEALLLDVMPRMKRYDAASVLLQMSHKQIFKVVEARLKTLSKKARMAAERHYKNITIACRAVDVDRFAPDCKDDEKATVTIDSLYNLAAGAIENWCSRCDGKAQTCKYREEMEILRIPANSDKGNCPYWQGYTEKEKTNFSRPLKAFCENFTI